MNSVQESKQELQAAIRYAENAISSAKATIESMEFRQQMAQKQRTEKTGREQALEQEVKELKKEVELYTKKYNDLAKQKDADFGEAFRDASREAQLMSKEFKKAVAEAKGLEERLDHEEAYSRRLASENEGLRRANKSLRKKCPKK